MEGGGGGEPMERGWDEHGGINLDGRSFLLATWLEIIPRFFFLPGPHSLHSPRHHGSTSIPTQLPSLWTEDVN